MAKTKIRLANGVAQRVNPASLYLKYRATKTESDDGTVAVKYDQW